jgi:hypothetical protein
MYISLFYFFSGMEDVDFRTPRDIEHELCKVYTLEMHEKQSLLQIERMIETQAYQTEEVVKQHMDFLEHLLFKIHAIRTDQIKEDFSTFDIDREIVRIQLLSKRLMHIRYFLDKDLMLARTLPTHKFKYA